MERAPSFSFAEKPVLCWSECACCCLLVSYPYLSFWPVPLYLPLDPVSMEGSEVREDMASGGSGTIPHPLGSRGVPLSQPWNLGSYWEFPLARRPARVAGGFCPCSWLPLLHPSGSRNWREVAGAYKKGHANTSSPEGAP